MAISPSAGRTAARRQLTIDEALDHAERILESDGAGAVTVSEVARRMGIRPPSLYKYFPSLHAIYDALFARGNERLTAYVEEAIRDREPGLDRLLEGIRSFGRWSMLNKGISTLLFWRPVPGFEPSPESFELAAGLVTRFRAELATAVRNGELADWADTDETFRLLTSISAGLCSQQLANEPGASYDDGAFTSLTDRALAMFVAAHAPASRKERP
ncbi:TetR/AcrR family transcriptional regulator [Nocardioides sp. SYSU DS0651]|uniref:TetR/AcrR family transcriptional regulator n=1 Tax=Nocardioides sp. SYSU DS0651 TaxID=3415955 RepID=UPI003F4C03C3